MNGSFAADYATAHYRVITGECFELLLPIRFKTFACQYQEDAMKLGNE